MKLKKTRMKTWKNYTNAAQSFASLAYLAGGFTVSVIFMRSWLIEISGCVNDKKKNKICEKVRERNETIRFVFLNGTYRFAKFWNIDVCSWSPNPRPLELEKECKVYANSRCLIRNWNKKIISIFQTTLQSEWLSILNMRCLFIDFNIVIFVITCIIILDKTKQHTTLWTVNLKSLCRAKQRSVFATLHLKL